MKKTDIESVNPEQGVLKVAGELCTMCYACIRACPVNAIEVRSGLDYVIIHPDRCTACGSCEMICPTKAITWTSDIDILQGSLNGAQVQVALVDPSISAEFPDIRDYRNFIGMIRGLGFQQVYDAAYGVDLLASHYRELLGDFKGKYWITSKCPAVTSTITMYYPDLVTNLLPLVPPYAAMAKFIKPLLPEDARITLITPCLAAKSQHHQIPPEAKVDYIITFRELRELFSRNQITENRFEYSDFDSFPGRDGSLFPMIHGMVSIAGLSDDPTKGNVISFAGKQNMLDALDEFSSGLEIRRHLDIFYCDGCFMGPGMSEHGKKFERRTLVTDYARKRMEIITEAQHLENLKPSENLEVRMTFSSHEVQAVKPDEADIQDVLTLIGKTASDDPDRGCQSCGYRSCRDFAIAVASGFAKPEMCQLFNSKNHQAYIKTLRETNDQLAKVQKALQESEKQAHADKEHSREYAETLQSLLQRIPSGVIIVNEHGKVIQANQVLISILGDEAITVSEIIPGLKGADIKSLFPLQVAEFFGHVQKSSQEILHRDINLNGKILNLSVFPIKKGSITGAVLRDLSSPEVRKEELFNRITEVIDNNLEMVQKIGFLLGEGAAETERMLNSIISYFKQDQQ